MARDPVDRELARSPRIRALLRRVVPACCPEQVLVFGSSVNGRAHPGSDLDVIVVTCGHGWCTTASQVRQLFWTSPHAVDPIVLSPEAFAHEAARPDSFVSTVLPSSVCVYRAS